MRRKLTGLIIATVLGAGIPACRPAVAGADCPMTTVVGDATTCTWIVDPATRERSLECRLGKSLRFRVDTSGVGEG